MLRFAATLFLSANLYAENCFKVETLDAVKTSAGPMLLKMKKSAAANPKLAAAIQKMESEVRPRTVAKYYTPNLFIQDFSERTVIYDYSKMTQWTVDKVAKTYSETSFSNFLKGMNTRGNSEGKRITNELRFSKPKSSGKSMKIATLQCEDWRTSGKSDVQMTKDKRLNIETEYSRCVSKQGPTKYSDIAKSQTAEIQKFLTPEIRKKFEHISSHELFRQSPLLAVLWEGHDKSWQSFIESFALLESLDIKGSNGGGYGFTSKVTKFSEVCPPGGLTAPPGGYKLKSKN